MEKSNNVKMIYLFFSSKKRRQLKKEYCEYFGVHPQTFYRKITPSAKFVFTLEEILWFERWAAHNGGPVLEQQQKISA